MSPLYVPMSKGTVLIPSGSTDHLHFVCNNPIYYPRLGKECVLVVNISSISADLDNDKSCLLDIGDHPFIRHPSYVYYRRADIFGSENIGRNIAEGIFRTHEDCEEQIFERVLHGFGISDEVKPKIYRFYEKFCAGQ